jgi:hypothetical protein
MSKPYTEQDLTDLFDADLIWRRKELSDVKSAIKAADAPAKPVLLIALIAISYAHWEGYIRTCSNRYFQHLTLRRKPFSELERQIYVNTFLGRVDAVHRQRVSLKDRCDLINDILDGRGGRFGYMNPSLLDTQSNLNTDVIKDICLICAVDPSHFESQRTFIDIFVLKRRDAIAHGQQEYIQEDEIDDLVASVLSLMTHFRTLLENKVYTKAYAAA